MCSTVIMMDCARGLLLVIGSCHAFVNPAHHRSVCAGEQRRRMAHPTNCAERELNWYVKTETFVAGKPFPEIAPYLAAHKEWVAALREEGSLQITSGYRVDENDRPGGGGLMLFAAFDYSSALALVQQDPLVANGCVDWQLNRWIAEVGDLALIDGGTWYEKQEKKAE